MTKAVADISISLDGYVTGPEPGPTQGLGRGGEPLHTWAISSEDPVDAEVLERGTADSGAVVMGRRLFDIIDGPQGWNDQVGYGASQAGTPPFFVVTHQAPTQHRLTNLDFTFVTDGIEAALEAARAAAGDRDAIVMGGGDVIGQAIAGGLVDELRIHLSPIVLGGGTRLFPDGVRRELEQESVRVSRYATHLTYRVI
jgi:dihydrofolate reductase